MSPILNSLWTQYEENHYQLPPAEVRERSHEYFERITKAFGIKFTDDLTNAISEEQSYELENAYQQGFLTAFQLWMEVFAQYPPRP